MFWTVSFNCEKCGNTKMVVTRDHGDGAIDGYCLSCGHQVSGSYVPVVEATVPAVAIRR